MRTASTGVTLRAWSSAGSPARRMPGVTSVKSSPTARRSSGASRAEQTTPSSPQARARRARRSTDSSTEPEKPTDSKSDCARLVRIVTAMSSGGRATCSRASRAARSIASPPVACTLSIQTPRRAAERQAPATVLGMSWNLRSRKISKPRSCSRSTTTGPAATKSSLPTFTRQRRGSRRAASASAASASGVSSATMMRLLSNLLPREMAPRALELGGAARRECLPTAACRALPEELARLEAAVRAQVHGEHLGVRMHERLHELQVLAPVGGRAHELRVDEPVEPHERGSATHLVANQPIRALVALVLGGRLVDDVEKVEARIAMLHPAHQRQSLARAPKRLVALHHALGREPEIGGVLR